MLNICITHAMWYGKRFHTPEILKTPAKHNNIFIEKIANPIKLAGMICEYPSRLYQYNEEGFCLAMINTYMKTVAIQPSLGFGLMPAFGKFETLKAQCSLTRPEGIIRWKFIYDL